MSTVESLEEHTKPSPLQSTVNGVESVQLYSCMVGDGAVGKTCFAIRACEGKFPMEYVPTVMDSFRKEFTMDRCVVRFDVKDTAGREDYDRLRRRYPCISYLLSFVVISLLSLSLLEHSNSFLHAITAHLLSRAFIQSPIHLRCSSRLHQV
jgi:GTPase SAR1 family protein